MKHCCSEEFYEETNIGQHRCDCLGLLPAIQERPMYRGSQSTLGGKWGPLGGVEVDELGRPVVWHDGGAEMDREKEESRRRVESYLKTSNMSLVRDRQLRD